MALPACRRPECGFLAHSQRDFDGFCCYRCLNGKGHGSACERHSRQTPDDAIVPLGLQLASREVETACQVSELAVPVLRLRFSSSEVFAVLCNDEKQWPYNEATPNRMSVSEEIRREDLYFGPVYQALVQHPLFSTFMYTLVEDTALNIRAVGVGSSKKKRERAGDLGLCLASNCGWPSHAHINIFELDCTEIVPWSGCVPRPPQKSLCDSSFSAAMPKEHGAMRPPWRTSAGGPPPQKRLCASAHKNEATAEWNEEPEEELEENVEEKETEKYAPDVVIGVVGTRKSAATPSKAKAAPPVRKNAIANPRAWGESGQRNWRIEGMETGETGEADEKDDDEMYKMAQTRACAAVLSNFWSSVRGAKQPPWREPEDLGESEDPAPAAALPLPPSRASSSPSPAPLCSDASDAWEDVELESGEDEEEEEKEEQDAMAESKEDQNCSILPDRHASRGGLTAKPKWQACPSRASDGRASDGIERPQNPLHEIFSAVGMRAEDIELIHAKEQLTSLQEFARAAKTEEDAEKWAKEIGLVGRIRANNFIRAWRQANAQIGVRLAPAGAPPKRLLDIEVNHDADPDIASFLQQKPWQGSKSYEVKCKVRDVRFTQGSISKVFSCGRTLDSLIKGVAAGIIDPLKAEFLVLEAVCKLDADGHSRFYSIDNRRLHCLQKAQQRMGKPLYVRLNAVNMPQPMALKRFKGHFDTKCQGKAVKVRGRARKM